MPRFHKVKRLHHPHRSGNEHSIPTSLPSKILDEELTNRSSQYVKYFDYPLAQSFADHSTDPLQNISRQYSNRSVAISSEGRFVNHEMIIRRNGETTILRSKHDVVLASGFTPVIRPSSILPSHHSLISPPQNNSSVSITTKMSMKNCEQTPIIKTKRKSRRSRKRCNQIYNQSVNHFQHDHFQKSHLLQLVEQAIHNLIDRQTSLPPPLMSIPPQFQSPQNQRSVNPPPYFNDRPFIPPITVDKCPEPFYDIPLPEQYHSFAQNHSSSFHRSPPEHFHSPMFPERHFTSMTNYFFQ